MDFKNISLPENNKLDNKFLEYKVEYKRENNTVLAERIFRLKVVKILPTDYLKFKQFCAEIDRLENEEIVIKK